MKYLLFIFLIFSIEGEEKTEFAYQRIFDKAENSIGWDKLTLREQILLVRKIALKQKTVSNPVSDRYQITAYGGPIDLVHFLMLASEALSDHINIKDRLYKEWEQEGGPQHIRGFDPRYPCEAHPDDLPSNALGALFGTDIKENKLNGTLRECFEEFIKPLKPVPDQLSKSFSHREIVMGLDDKADKKTETSRYIWFTASPLNLTTKLNAASVKLYRKPFCKESKSGTQCLGTAGFTVESYKGKPILIKRIGIK